MVRQLDLDLPAFAELIKLAEGLNNSLLVAHSLAATQAALHERVLTNAYEEGRAQGRAEGRAELRPRPKCRRSLKAIQAIRVRLIRRIVTLTLARQRLATSPDLVPHLDMDTSVPSRVLSDLIKVPCLVDPSCCVADDSCFFVDASCCVVQCLACLYALCSPSHARHFEQEWASDFLYGRYELPIGGGQTGIP